MMYMVVSGILVCLYEIFICFVRLCICALYVFPLSSIVKRFEFLKALYKFPIIIIIIIIFRDWEHRTATSTFTQLLSFEH